MLKKYLYLTLFILFSTTLLSAEVNKSSIKKLVILSGLKTQVAQIPELVKTGLNQGMQAENEVLSANEYSAIMKSVDDSVNATKMLNELSLVIQESFTQKEVDELLTWYSSDVARKITQEEELSSTPEAYVEIMQTADTLLTDTPQVKFAQKMDELLGATEMTLKFQEKLILSMYSASMLMINPNEEVDLAPLKAQMDQNRVQTRMATKQMTLISFVYTYKHINPTHLKMYEKFLETPTAQKFNTTVATALLDTMNEAFTQWIVKLIEVMKHNQELKNS